MLIQSVLPRDRLLKRMEGAVPLKILMKLSGSIRRVRSSEADAEKDLSSE